MACVGRTKVCNIVPQNHFGPIPGIEVGMGWKYRVQVSKFLTSYQRILKHLLGSLLFVTLAFSLFLAKVMMS